MPSDDRPQADGGTELTPETAPAETTAPDTAQPKTAPAESEARDVAAPEVWHRVHPLTPILESLGVLVVFAIAAAYSAQNFIQGALEGLATGEGVDLSFAGWLRSHPLVLLIGLGAIVLVLLITGLYSWLAWKVMGYRVDEDALYARSGLMFKKQRKARLDRVQSIDLKQKLLPRLFGLAELVFDVAGGSDSNVSLKYLKRRKAEILRDELLGAVRAVKRSGDSRGPAGPGAALPGAASPGTTATGAATPGTIAADAAPTGAVHDPGPIADGPVDAPVDTSVPERRGDSIGVRLTKRLGALAGGALEEVEDSLNSMLAPYQVSTELGKEGEIIRVPVHRMIAASLLKTETLVTVLVFLGLFVAVGVLFVLGLTEVAVPLLFGALPGLFAAGAVVKKDLGNANFVVRMTESGLAVSHGLFSTSRKVIPLDRVQAVSLHQPFLWRLTGWWKAEYNIASGSDSADTNLLLPVGDIDQALLMIGLALPDPQVEDGVSARSLILSAMYDRKSTDPDAAAAEARFFRQPPSSRFIDPLVWKRRAYTLTSALLILRLGAVERRVDFVPHERVQSMQYRQGPLMRALGLGSVAVHSTTGPIKPRVTHQSQEHALRFFRDHAERTRLARQRFDAEAREPTENQQ